MEEEEKMLAEGIAKTPTWVWNDKGMVRNKKEVVRCQDKGAQIWGQQAVYR